MRFTAKRLLAAGAIGVSAIVTPLSLTAALSAVGGAPSSVAGAQGPFDELLFNQTTGTSPDNFQYQTADGVVQDTQPANISGDCATPTAGGDPILQVCGELYSSIAYGPGGTIKPASLGTNGTATGVGAITPAWTIDNKSNKGAEAIAFSPGSGPGAAAIIGQHRAFADAQIPVQRKDSGVSQPSLIVQLAEFDSSVPPVPGIPQTPLGIQDCTINGGQGTQLTVSPNSAACKPVPAGSAVPTEFHTIEVRDATTSTSISVVGQTAAFDLLTQICGGQQINPVNDGGGVNATLTLTGASTECKTYTSFTTTIQSGTPTLAFNGLTGSNVQFTVQITWPPEPLCSPYVDSTANPAPTAGGIPGTGITDATGLVGGAAADICPVHQFSLDDAHFYDQGYCQSAQQPGAGVEVQQELCTVAKSYSNDTIKYVYSTGAQSACPGPLPQQPCIPVTTPIVVPNTNPPEAGTQITETWVGFVDMRLH